jgi:serine phosphatase RsbU (regulator of sigma subunit)
MLGPFLPLIQRVTGLDRIRIIDPDGNAETAELDPSREYAVGRSPRGDIVLDDPSLSRRHARLEHRDGVWTIRDCGSVNGTFVGDTRISGPVRLTPGMRVLMGRSALEVEGEAAPRTRVSFSNAPFERAGATMFSAELSMADPPTLEDATDPGSGPHALRALKFIERANLELLAHEPLDVLLPKVVDLICEAVEPDRAALLVLDEQGRLECRAARGDSASIAISRTIASTVIEERASILTGNAEGDVRFGQRQSILGLRAVMAVPLIDRHGVSGLIYADSRSESRTFTESDLRLLTVLAKVSAVQVENARLFQAQLEEQRLERELGAAATIQKRLLPRRPPAIAGYSIRGMSEPCRGVGGDWFGCVQVSPDRYLIGLADVAGKGMPAALLMAAFQATFVARAEAGNAIDRLVAGLNRAMNEQAPSDRFVTLFACDLDPSKHRLRWINAGHAPPPLCVRANGETEPLVTRNVPLGIVPDFEYEVRELQLEPGDAVFACSDGVTDATDGDGSMFGDERLAEVLRAHAGSDALRLLTEVHTGVQEFAGGVEPPDDVTILAIARADDA